MVEKAGKKRERESASEQSRKREKRKKSWAEDKRRKTNKQVLDSKLVSAIFFCPWTVVVALDHILCFDFVSLSRSLTLSGQLFVYMLVCIYFYPCSSYRSFLSLSRSLIANDHKVMAYLNGHWIEYIYRYIDRDVSIYTYVHTYISSCCCCCCIHLSNIYTILARSYSCLVRLV